MTKKNRFKLYFLTAIIVFCMTAIVSCGIPFPFPNITLPITTQKSITALSITDLNSNPIINKIELTFDNELTEPLSGFKVYYKDADGFTKPATLYWINSSNTPVYNNNYIAVTVAQLNSFVKQSPHFIFYFNKAILGTYPTPIDSATSIVVNYSICDDKGNDISLLFEAGEKIIIYFIPMVFMGPPINAVVPINAFSSTVNKTDIIFSK